MASPQSILNPDQPQDDGSTRIVETDEPINVAFWKAYLHDLGETIAQPGQTRYRMEPVENGHASPEDTPRD